MYANENNIVGQINAILPPLGKELYSKPAQVASIDEFFQKYGDDFWFGGVFSHIIKKVKFPAEALERHITIFDHYDAFRLLAVYQDLPESFIEKHLKSFKEYLDELALHQKFSDEFLTKNIINLHTYYLKNPKSLNNSENIYSDLLNELEQNMMKSMGVTHDGNDYTFKAATDTGEIVTVHGKPFEISNWGDRKKFKENTQEYIEDNDLLAEPEPKLNIKRENFNSVYHIADNMLELEWDAITKSKDLSWMVQNFYTLDKDQRAYFLNALIKAFAAELGIPEPNVIFVKHPDDKEAKKHLAAARKSDNTIIIYDSLLKEKTRDLAQFLGVVPHEFHHLLRKKPGDNTLDKLRQGPSLRHQKYQAAYYQSELYQKGYEEYLNKLRWNEDKQQEEMEAILINSHIERAFDKRILNKDMVVPLSYFYNIDSNSYWDPNLTHKANARIPFGFDENAHIPGKIKRRLDDEGVPQFATAGQYLKIFEDKFDNLSFTQKVWFMDYRAEELYHKDIQVGATEQKLSLCKMLHYPNWYRIFPKDFLEMLASDKYPKMQNATGWGYDDWFLEGQLKQHHLYALQATEEIPALEKLYTSFKDLTGVKKAAGDVAAAKKRLGVKPYQTFKATGKKPAALSEFAIKWAEDKNIEEEKPAATDVSDLQNQLENEKEKNAKLNTEWNEKYNTLFDTSKKLIAKYKNQLAANNNGFFANIGKLFR
ncbi:MAG: hypothetical protein FWF97_04600 [Alphaproteobacteria bacterium]|nr:hypothetical protein [Alphaproteobacteria bacterium]